MRCGRRSAFPKHPIVLLGELNYELGLTPYEIVYEEDRIKLKHYFRNENAENKLKTPLLVVYALINRETMLDLQPDRSVVKTFLAGRHRPVYGGLGLSQAEGPIPDHRRSC